EKLDPAGEVLHDLALARHHRLEVELRAGDPDTVRGEMVPGLGVALGRVQERLRGDAADVETGPAQGASAFDAGRAHAELRGADGGDIAAGSGADHHEVVR